MPALAEASQALPRLIPPCDEAKAGAGPFPKTISRPVFQSGQPRQSPESMDRLAHDARNVLSGLMLYSELLATPGVLNPAHGHYARELETITGTAAWLLEKIVETTAPNSKPDADRPAAALQKTRPGAAGQYPELPTATAVPLAPVPVTDAAAELRRLQPLLAAVAGSAVRLAVATMPCAGRTALAIEDFTRVLINLVRNAADAMSGGGHIGIAVQYRFESESAPSPQGVVLTVSDDGPGIPDALRRQIFDLGFTTHKESADWPTPRRRGLGLSIVRNLVEAAGGAVQATASYTGGARFEIVLPFYGPVPSRPEVRRSAPRDITSGTCSLPLNETNPADSAAKGCIECQ